MYLTECLKVAFSFNSVLVCFILILILSKANGAYEDQIISILKIWQFKSVNAEIKLTVFFKVTVQWRIKDVVYQKMCTFYQYPSALYSISSTTLLPCL